MGRMALFYAVTVMQREMCIRDRYYVHDCHPAIIDRGTFQKVQEELARRSSLKKTSSKAKTQLGKYCGKYVLSELLVLSLIHISPRSLKTEYPIV